MTIKKLIILSLSILTIFSIQNSKISSAEITPNKNIITEKYNTKIYREQKPSPYKRLEYIDNEKRIEQIEVNGYIYVYSYTKIPNSKNLYGNVYRLVAPFLPEGVNLEHIIYTDKNGKVIE